MAEMREIVELYLQCENLPLGCSPFAILQVNLNNMWFECNRTIAEDSNNNPSWPMQFRFTFRFEEIQILRALILDKGPPDWHDLEHHSLLGFAEFSLANVVRDKIMNLTLKLDIPDDLNNIIQLSANTNYQSGTSPMLIVRSEHVAQSAAEQIARLHNSSSSSTLAASQEAKMDSFEEVLQFQFSAVRKLAKKDGFFGKSDPYLAICRKLDDGSWLRVYTSEVIKQNLLPQWKLGEISVQQLCNHDYDKQLQVAIWDWNQIESHTYMGSFQSTLRELISSAGLAKDFVVIEEEEVAEDRKKKKKRYVDSGALRLVRSVIVSSRVDTSVAAPRRGSSYENCRTFRSDVTCEAFGLLNVPIIPAQIASNPNRNLTDLAFDLVSTPANGYFALINDQRHYFLDYLSCGNLEISVLCAIDFTASNGDPNTPTSLHYVGEGVANQYECAIRDVCEVVIQYDTDKIIPTYGFGVQFKSKYHDIIKLDEANGVEGVLNAYKTAVSTCRLSGPTLFLPVINEAVNICRNSFVRTESTPPAFLLPVYTVLLLICDGTYDDRLDAITRIVEISSMPLSIIIIGVGEANFDSMEELDSDDTMLTDVLGNMALRDIVQFVSYKKVENSARAAGISFKEELSRQVLAEIPFQLCQFMQSVRSC